MKRLLAAALLTGMCSCTEHVYTHRDTSVWRAAPSVESSSSYLRSPEAPAATITPYVPETVEAVRAE